MKLILHVDKHQVICKSIVSYLMRVARHAYSTQNNKYVITLWYLKKKVSDEVDFLHGDKHLSVLQVCCISCDGFGFP